VPTLTEEGADPGLTVYFCIFAPAKTPAAIVERLSAEFAKAIRTPRVQDFYRTYTLRPEGNTPAEFAEFLKSDRANATRVFTTLGIRPGAAPQ
jgi:tripartite-type tricarboxylate transporter receptor subunit TctC